MVGLGRGLSRRIDEDVDWSGIRLLCGKGGRAASLMM